MKLNGLNVNRAAVCNAIMEKMLADGTDSDLGRLAKEWGVDMKPHEVDPNRRPVAFGYVRISALASEDESLGIESQRTLIKRYYDQTLAPSGYLWGDIYQDANVSGAKRFDKRPAGRQLALRMTPGDIIVALSFDRMFRRLNDALVTTRRWVDSGSKIYFVRDNWEMSAADFMRMFSANLFFMVAELEHYLCSIRNRESKVVLRKLGRPICGYAPIGFRIVGDTNKRSLAPDEEQLTTIGDIVAMKKSGLSFDDIYLRLDRNRVTYAVTRKRPSGGYREARVRWCKKRIIKAYNAAGVLLGQETPEPVGGLLNSSTNGAHGKPHLVG